MPFPPTGYPFADDSVPGAGDGDPIRAADINDIITYVDSLDGGAGSAVTYSVDHAGAFGPGFDALHTAGSGPFTDPSLNWGPDYFLYQTPWGTYATLQAAEGDTIVCAGYLDASYDQVPANEVIWVLTSGAWVVDTTKPVTSGTLVTVNALSTTNPDDVWTTGQLYVKDPDGRIELANTQFHRAQTARMSAVVTVDANGTDDDIGGAPLGTVLVDTTGADTTRTLPQYVYPGREIVYLNLGNDGHDIIIAPPAGVTIVGSTTVSGYLNWSAYLFDGTQWYCRPQTIDAAYLSYTPGTPGDWPTAPTTVAEALDLLAARVAALEP